MQEKTIKLQVIKLQDIDNDVKSNTNQVHESQHSQVINNQQTLDLSSLLKFPNGKFNLTINNSNVIFNFNGK